MKYSYEKLLEVYTSWVNAKVPRHDQWNRYVEIRDGLPIGILDAIEYPRQTDIEEFIEAGKRMVQ
jgi:hypothetical protein